MPHMAETTAPRGHLGHDSDLFTVANPATPLAERLRPGTVAEVIGQRHLLAPGKPLAVAFASGKPHSMILWGPPGVGKTTLARLMADAFNAEFIALSAVLSGVKDIRDAVARAEATLAQSGRHTILFVDEVHRFNKAQQDAFLPVRRAGARDVHRRDHRESVVRGDQRAVVARGGLRAGAADRGGLAPALRSRRCRRDAGHVDRCRRARCGDRLRGWRRPPPHQHGRAARHRGGRRPAAPIDMAFVEATIARWLRRFDKGGEAFYDQISALHKAVRGSNPDAALYWMCRMLDGGADPLYVGRRLMRMASEDIGLADPRALALTVDAVAVYERLGTPEGELALAEAVIYLACAPKSNAVYMAYNAARAFIAEDGSRPVPLRLRNAPTRLMKDLDYGKGYRYAHDEEGAYAAGERYFPDGMPEMSWYAPTDRGLEAKIRERLEWLRAQDRKARETGSGGVW